MAIYRGKRRLKFGVSGGIHSKQRKVKYRHKYSYKLKQNRNICTSTPTTRLTIVRRSLLKKYKIRNKRREGLNRLLFVKHQPQLNIKRVSYDKPLVFNINKVASEGHDGYRLMNLQLLQQHLHDITLHVASCPHLDKIVCQQHSPVKLVSEVRTLGLASVLKAECQGCKHVFILDTSPQLKNGHTNHYDINVRAVWGSMATGGGAAHLNETMATLNSPGLSQTTYSNIEEQIGDMWNLISQEDILAAGAEERHIAISKGDYHEGVPCIKVICDGGWSKRSHKHTYNALGGVAVIIGAETGKILHIGVRNKYCYICCQAESSNTQPRQHRCFKNWSDSSQAMESSVIVEGFQQAEKVHGLRYTTVIADGDSSVYAKIQESVPWGRDVIKQECANHVCKCLRSSLEKLVDGSPMYKGKNRLTKALRVRLTSAVRCAIRMRSSERDRKIAAKKLDHDIRNSIYHILGRHVRCSDFCKARSTQTVMQSDSQTSTEDSSADQGIIDSVADDMATIWNESTSLDDQEAARGGSSSIDIDAMMLRDVNVLLDRVANKAGRLLENTTTNLAECWMSIRAKFDGGKCYNRCNRGSWHFRCFGGSLRKNLGPLWSPITWQKGTSTEPGFFFTKLYDRRKCTLETSTSSKKKPEQQQRRWKRKYQSAQQSSSKKARMEYGPEAVDSTPDVSPEQLQKKQQEYLKKHIDLAEDQLDTIERVTKQQSTSVAWLDERKKRITASNFASVVKRNPSIPVKKLVASLLYSNFKGNASTRRGLQQETMTVKEYVSRKAESKEMVSVQPCGLIISKEHKFLAASPDGKVVNEAGVVVGLLEMKNLVHTKPINLHEAVKAVNSFCLEHYGSSEELRLKVNHPYFYQVQGQLNIANIAWADFVVRTVNPYQIHIERIYRDQDLWTNTMVPKLQAFYFNALLPELASPRNNTLSGIREPGTWFEKKKTTTSCRPASSSTRTAGKAEATDITITKKSTTTCTSQHRKDTISPLLAASTTSRRPKRAHRIKFVGRRISHEWEDDVTKKKTWYTGTVTCTLSGKDGEPGAVYEVLYDGEQDACQVDDLLDDYESSTLKFIDL